jgi:hypothetical protein
MERFGIFVDAAYRLGHSLVVFDHWPRVQRLPYLTETLGRLRIATGAATAFSVWGTDRVAFHVVPQADHAKQLEDGALAFTHRWPEFRFTK